MRIPPTKDEKETAEFWSTHDAADYINDTEPVSIEIDPALREKVRLRALKKKPVTLRLEEEQIAAAKAIAAEKSIPYQTLIRMWVAEAIQRERAAKSADS